jgi:IS605 OrfB family transposase
LALLELADVEKERQRAERTRLTELARSSGRLKANGRPAFTRDEHALMGLAPGAVQTLSPTLVVNRKGISINVPIERNVTVVKAEPGRLAGMHERVVTVDVNMFNVSVVAWDGTKVVAVKKFSYGAMQSNRERQVGKAIGQSRASAGRNRGEKQSVRLWQSIADLGETTARQVAAWVVKFAVEHQATVIVTEALGHYSPERATASKRANRRRSYWLHGRIRKYIADAALASGILKVQRNPAWTSHQCPKCHRLGERFSESRTNPANRARFRCLNQACRWTGDADIAAALNLHRKWTRTFVWPSQDEIAAHRARNPKTPKRRGASGTANPSRDKPQLAVPAMFERGTKVAA